MSEDASVTKGMDHCRMCVCVCVGASPTPADIAPTSEGATHVGSTITATGTNFISGFCMHSATAKVGATDSSRTAADGSWSSGELIDE